MIREELIDLLAELTALAVTGARQSTALGNLLVDKGLATREELDQYLSSTAPMKEKLSDLVRQLQQELNRNPETH